MTQGRPLGATEGSPPRKASVFQVPRFLPCEGQLSSGGGRRDQRNWTGATTVNGYESSTGPGKPVETVPEGQGTAGKEGPKIIDLKTENAAAVGEGLQLNVVINGVHVDTLVDTGATVSLLSDEVVKRW